MWRMIRLVCVASPMTQPILGFAPLILSYSWNSLCNTMCPMTENTIPAIFPTPSGFPSLSKSGNLLLHDFVSGIEICNFTKYEPLPCLYMSYWMGATCNMQVTCPLQILSSVQYAMPLTGLKHSLAFVTSLIMGVSLFWQIHNTELKRNISLWGVTATWVAILWQFLYDHNLVVAVLSQYCSKIA